MFDEEEDEPSFFDEQRCCECDDGTIWVDGGFYSFDCACSCHELPFEDENES